MEAFKTIKAIIRTYSDTYYNGLFHRNLLIKTMLKYFNEFYKINENNEVEKVKEDTFIYMFNNTLRYSVVSDDLYAFINNIIEDSFKDIPAKETIYNKYEFVDESDITDEEANEFMIYAEHFKIIEQFLLISIVPFYGSDIRWELLKIFPPTLIKKLLLSEKYYKNVASYLFWIIRDTEKFIYSEIINDMITIMKEDGDYKRLFDKWNKWDFSYIVLHVFMYYKEYMLNFDQFGFYIKLLELVAEVINKPLTDLIDLIGTEHFMVTDFMKRFFKFSDIFNVECKFIKISETSHKLYKTNLYKCYCYKPKTNYVYTSHNTLTRYKIEKVEENDKILYDDEYDIIKNVEEGDIKFNNFPYVLCNPITIWRDNHHLQNKTNIIFIINYYIITNNITAFKEFIIKYKNDLTNILNVDERKGLFSENILFIFMTPEIYKTVSIISEELAKRFLTYSINLKIKEQNTL